MNRNCKRNLILGSGLAGLSCSFHLGHGNCVLLEERDHAFGHIHSTHRKGFTWDEGPHVSFTKHEYVRSLFADSVGEDLENYEVKAINYFRGNWIDHPAQSNLYQIPEPLRTECLDSFLESRASGKSINDQPASYQHWLETAFGKVFANTFPRAYTRKYWTCDPSRLTTGWVGSRVFKPNVDDVINGARGPLSRPTHYITRVRYPKKGGYQSFAKQLALGASVRLRSGATRIDLKKRRLWTQSGEVYGWDRLINTMPLPKFIRRCLGVPAAVTEAVNELACSELLLINVTAQHPTLRGENWMYVYDEDKLCTRINCTEKLTPGNAPSGSTGVQVEVYASRFRPSALSSGEIEKKVVTELRGMGLIEPQAAVDTHTVSVPWANVIFTHETRSALDVIWAWLAQYGLEREEEDLLPMTDWATAQAPVGSIVMAGRFGQWKYFWTDDCVLRGRLIAET